MTIHRELDRISADERTDNWCIPPESGAFLTVLARLNQAKRILEVGTSIGYSGLWWLSALQETGGVLETLDVSTERQAIARSHFEAAGVLDRVTFHTGEALERLSQLPDDTYDLMFLDAHKADYIHYFEHAQRLLIPGGLLVADNTTSHRAAMPGFVEAVQASGWIYSELATVGSGLLLAIKPN